MVDHFQHFNSLSQQMMTRDQIQTVLTALEGLNVPYGGRKQAIALLQAALAEPSEAVAWSESAIDEYLDGYSLIGDDGDYTPSEDEKFVIKDAIIGFMSPTPETKTSISLEDIQQAVARGWCSDRNLLKRMDSDLATDIADQVAALLFTHPAPRLEPDWLLVSTTSLAMSLWRRHYKDEAPDWKPLPDLAGVISQIDNMVYGLVKPSKPEPLTADEVWKSDAIMTVNASMDVKMNDLMKLVRAIEQAVWEKMK